MNYLSPEIAALVKRKTNDTPSLVKKGYSCGIFQDYGHEKTIHSEEQSQDTSK